MQFRARPIRSIFILQWTVATALGITVGKLLGTFAGGFGLAFRLPGAFALAGLVVGTVVGLMQRLVLRQHLVNQVEGWTLATAGGGILGGALTGSVISMLPINIALYISSILVGVIAGTTVGITQWLILRKWVHKARWWVLANTIAWTVGEFLLWAVIFLVMDGSRVIVNGVVIGWLTCKGEVVIFISGAVTGLITGIPLLWLLRPYRQ